MKQAVFLYNELLDENIQKLTKIPLEFVCFAYVKDVTLYKKKDKYYAIRSSALKKKTKHKRVYGAIYILHSSEKYLRNLDAFMVCSRSFIGKNHKNDIMHREKVKARPIHFKSIEEFVKMRYNEMEEIDVIMYLANHDNEFIKANVTNTVKNREVIGFDINNYINLVLKEKSDNEK